MPLILHHRGAHLGTHTLAIALAGLTLIAPLSAAARQAAPPAAVLEASKPPQITYEDGQLTIIANNVPLSEVLAAVRNALGADIDLPAGAASQRIWVQLGPGPARKVLRDLLDGTEFDYVMQASEKDEDGVLSIQLSARSKSSETEGPGAMVARRDGRRGSPVNPSSPEAAELEPSQSAQPVTAAEAALPDSQSPPAVPTATPEPTRLQAQPMAAEAGAGGPLGGSQAQMIQQLQSLYQQRKQIQIDQNQKPPAPN